VSIPHIESFEIDGDESFLAEIDRGYCAGTIFNAVDCAAEELACRAGKGDLVCFRDHTLHFNCCVGCIFQVPHRNDIDVQKHQNTIGARIEVGVAQ